jgi:hypothetical protein
MHSAKCKFVAAQLLAMLFMLLPALTELLTHQNKENMELFSGTLKEMCCSWRIKRTR